MFRSGSANIRGLFYKASGAGPFPTVILCHGFPGNDTDVLGLGQTLMKRGFNALAFNYRGTWGSEGVYTVANSLEDAISAIHYAESSVVVREFNVDSSRIAIIGYSFGGGMALLASLTSPVVKKVAYIGGGDLAEVGRRLQQDAEYKRAIERLIDQGISASGFRAQTEQLVAEMIADIDKYDLVKQAHALSDKDILLIGGWHDQENIIEHHLLPLFRALQKHEAKGVQIEIFDTDHSFTNVREELAEKITAWLKRNS